MDSHDWFPRIMCFADHQGDSMVYFGPHDQIEIEGYIEPQQALLRLCTGCNTAAEIINSLVADHDRDLLISLLQTLRDQKLVVDSRNCWESYHLYTCNPMPFVSNLTTEEALQLVLENAGNETGEVSEHLRDAKTSGSIADILSKRCFCRQFTGEEISLEHLHHLVWCCYGRTTLLLDGLCRRTVPSAGGLYPLSIHVSLRVPCGSFDSGIYRIDSNSSTLVEVTGPALSGWTEFAECFLDDSYLHTCALCVAVSATFDRETRKYSDRGYRYSILEAGHAAQNLLLACSELGLGCVEVGGFSDEKLKHVLSLEDSAYPLTTVFVGKIDSHELQNNEEETQ